MCGACLFPRLVSPVVRVRRPSSGSNHITHTHNPQHRLVVLCPFSNPSSRCIRPRLSPPRTARGPAPSAGQGDKTLYARDLELYHIIQAHRRTTAQARQGKGQHSSAGKSAVNSRRRPVKRLPRVAKEHQSACHLAVKQVTCSLLTFKTQSNGSGTAGQAKHAAAAAAPQKAQGRNPSNNILL